MTITIVFTDGTATCGEVLDSPVIRGLAQAPEYVYFVDPICNRGYCRINPTTFRLDIWYYSDSVWEGVNHAIDKVIFEEECMWLINQRNLTKTRKSPNIFKRLLSWTLSIMKH